MATLTASPLKVAGQDILQFGNASALVINYDGAVTTADTLQIDLQDRELLFGSTDPALSVVGLSENYTVAVVAGVLVITPVANFVASDFGFFILLKK